VEALIGVFVGGLLATAGSWVVGHWLDRRGREHQQRTAQLEAAREVLVVLQ
jgi:hypothetical protein